MCWCSSTMCHIIVISFAKNILGFSGSHSGIQHKEKAEIRKQKPEMRIPDHEKPFIEIYWQQWKFPSKMWFLRYAYDNNCLYWIEYKLFLFLYFIFAWEYLSKQRKIQCWILRFYSRRIYFLNMYFKELLKAWRKHWGGE